MVVDKLLKLEGFWEFKHNGNKKHGLIEFGNNKMAVVNEFDDEIICESNIDKVEYYKGDEFNQIKYTLYFPGQFRKDKIELINKLK